jgi:hypothetical protein
MKYRAIIMAPKVVEFENSGNNKNISNQGWALCSDFNSVVTSDMTFGPKLLAIIPALSPEEPLVFDPPPMAA